MEWEEDDGLWLSEIRGLRSHVLDHIIEDMITPGLTVLGGDPKCGKSILALNMAMCVAGGDPLFGEVKTRPGKVLYLGLEDTKFTTSERIDGMLGERSGPQWVRFYHRWPRLQQGAEERFLSFIKANPDTSMIVIDVYQRIKPTGRAPSTNWYQEEYDLLEPLAAMGKEFGVGVLMIHHTRKGQPGSDIFETLSSSQGMVAVSDSILILDATRRKHVGKLHKTGRRVRDDVIPVAMEDLWWVKRDAQESAPKPKSVSVAKPPSITQRIERLTRTLDYWPTAVEVSERLGISYPTCQKTLKRLQDKAGK